MMGPRRPATLPMDLLLEIIARCDVTTVVRCAMSSKTLLHGILDHRAKANGGFDPGLLMAVSYRLTVSHSHIDSDEGTTITTCTSSVVVQPPGGLRRLGTDLLAGRSSAPISSRDGLLVLFQNKRVPPAGRVVGDGILVANTITGGVTSLPCMGQRGTSTAGMYRPALLSVDGAGRSFELLVMYRHDDDRSLVTQIFSSQQENEWGAARMIHIHNMPPRVDRLKEAAASTAPAVVGRSVHWLCYTQELTHQPNYFNDRDLIILALDAESAQATVIKLPQELLTQIGSRSNGAINPEARLILAATPAATAQGEGERQLSLVVAEALVISTWTLLVADEGSGSSISWSRQVVIRRRDIDSPLAYVLDAYQTIWFTGFGERSGNVLFWMGRTGLVQLNLGTKKALVLCRHTNISQALLHEINLVSILRCMEFACFFSHDMSLKR